jgi:hypothetical protein
MYPAPVLLVIFGAGASCDCGPLARPARPPLPLTASLLDPHYREIAYQYRGSMAVIDYLDQATRHGSCGLEQALDRLPDDPVWRRQLVAFRFYLCQLLAGTENTFYHNAYGQTYYMTLLGYLARWQYRSREPVTLLTFNYDTLVDRAAREVITDWQLDSFADYVARDDWMLVKLHGSLDWSRVARYPRERPLLGDNADHALAVAEELADTDVPFVLHSALDAENYDDAPRNQFGAELPSETRPVLIPALSVPLEAKTTFECEAEHIMALREAVPRVSRMLICGWRGTDQHAVDLLRGSGLSRDSRLGVVAKTDDAGGGGSAETLTNLSDLVDSNNMAFSETEGMTPFVQRMDELLPRLLEEG